MAYRSTAMQYKVSVMSGMVTVELGLLRQKSSCWMSFTLLERRTMAATKAHTLMPWREVDQGREKRPKTRGTINKNHIRQPAKKPRCGVQGPFSDWEPFLLP